MLQWTWRCRYLFKVVFSFSLDKCPEEEFVDHMVVPCLNFRGNSILCSTVAVPIYILTNSAQKGSLFSTTSPALVISSLFDTSLSDRCEIIAPGFDLYFPDGSWCLSTFSYTCWPLAYLLWENVYLDLLPIF